jgi:putative DNA primase/helicase
MQDSYDPPTGEPHDADEPADFGWPDAQTHLDALSPVDPYSYTDDGNAQRLVEKYGAYIRFVPQAGKWLTWDTYRWHWDDENKIQQAARFTIRGMRPLDTDSEKHRRRSLGKRSIDAMIQLASSDPLVVAHAHELDGRRLHLNTPGGIVDLVTGHTSRPDQSALHTRSTCIAPDPTQLTPRWHSFLNDTFSGDAEMIRYVQRLAGYSASGDVRYHVLPFLYGGGQNGKSVLTEIMRTLLGDYAATAPRNFLMAQKYSGHETQIARLQGLRLVIASEVNQDQQFDEAKVKELTGGDALTARFMHKDYFTFEPTHHLWIAGNHKPSVRAGGDSFWRRLRLVPFVHRVPDDKRITNLAQILVAEEGPGILAWIIAGAVDLFSGGMREPQSVIEETQTYADEENHLARFLDECCLVGGGELVKTETKALRGAYDRWCGAEGERPLTPQSFGRELKTLGIDSAKSNGRRFYLGLSLLSLDEPDAGDADAWK